MKSYSLTSSISQHLNAWFNNSDYSHLRKFICQIHGVQGSLKRTQVSPLPSSSSSLWQCTRFTFQLFAASALSFWLSAPKCNSLKAIQYAKSLREMGLASKCHEDDKLLLKALNSYSDASLTFPLMAGNTVVVVLASPRQGKSALMLQEVAPLLPVPGS